MKTCCATLSAIFACMALCLPSCKAFVSIGVGNGVGFQHVSILGKEAGSVVKQSRSTQLRLVPLTQCSSEDFTTLLSKSESYSRCFDKEGLFINNCGTDGENGDDGLFQLCVIEEKDLSELSRFVVATFGAEAIRLSTSDMNSIERMLITPAVSLVNGYSELVAFAEVFSGTKQRASNRIQRRSKDILLPPAVEGLSRNEMITLASKESLILAVGKQKQLDGEIEIIATIELRLQPCDAKIPFSLPWLDRIERNLAALIGLQEPTNSTDLQPYLSNLCVDEKYRGKKIGRALVQCVETITTQIWGYNRMYLHVDLDNAPAFKLYKTEGYKDVGQRWNPFWAGSAADIGYFVKSLPSSSTGTTKR